MTNDARSAAMRLSVCLSVTPMATFTVRQMTHEPETNAKKASPMCIGRRVSYAFSETNFTYFYTAKMIFLCFR